MSEEFIFGLLRVLAAVTAVVLAASLVATLLSYTLGAMNNIRRNVAAFSHAELECAK